MTEYYKELWQVLFKRYFHDEILELAENFPDKQDLIISYPLLETAWKSLTKGDEAIKKLIFYPDVALGNAHDELQNYPLPIDRPVGWETARVKISGFPTTAIRDLRYEHLEKLVSVTGTILRKTDVRFKIVNAAFKCRRCGNITNIPQASDTMVEPFECESEACGRRGPFEIIRNESEWANRRKIRLQESLDQMPGREQSLSVLDAIQIGDVECPPLGSIVTATGILRGIQTILNNAKTLDYYPLLDIVNLDVLDKEKPIELTPGELVEMQKMAKDPNIIPRLVASTVPSVRGHELIKEACLCSAVSPNNFLLPDGRKLRGFCHVMLCGDPSVAKSVMMQGLLGLVPRAQYAAGRAASSKGLTVSVTKDKGGWGEGAWVAEAGMLVLADMALACVDELDKFEKEEQRDLNTVLEHSIVPVHKAGIHRDYLARVPVIAGLNPKYGRFDRYEPIVKQVNVPPDTLSRFDLVFAMLDVPNKFEDGLTGRHITTLWRKTTEIHQKEFQNTGEVAQAWGSDQFTPEISIDMLRKWIAHAKKIKVRITKECEDAIYSYFMQVRLQTSDDPTAGIPVVWRTLDGMMRLLICETRLRHGNVTEMRDVERVRALVEESFKIAIDPETGKLDSDIISTGVSKSMRDRMKVLREIVEDLQTELGTAVSIEEIIRKAEEAGIKKESVEDMLEKLKFQGEVYEVSVGRYRVT